MDKVLLYKALAKNGAEKSASGNPVVLTDTIEGKLLKDLKLYGMSEQESTTGANLIDVDSMLSECLVKNDDGTYSILKTETDRFSKSFPVNLTAGTEVRLDADVIEYSGTYASHLRINFSNWQSIRENETLIINSDVTRAEIYQHKENDVGTYTKFKNAMLSIGEAQIPYEPYTGGKPSPSPDYPQEIKRVVKPVVKVCGKNLWNPIAGGYISNLNGSITASEKSDIATTDFIKTNGKDITVIARDFSLAIEYAFAYRIGFYDAEKKWIKNVVLSDGNKHSINTFNTTDAEYIRVSAPAGVYDTIQIEKGSEATSYEPYTEQTIQLPYTLNAIQEATGIDANITIDGQRYVADYVDADRGKFVQMINSLTLDGDKLKFVADSTNTYWNLPQQSAVKPSGYFALSKYFSKRNFLANSAYNFIYTTKNEMAGLFETADELNAFVAQKYKENDPVILYYFMREPIENDLAPEEIEALKALKTYTGTTIVGNDAECYMEVTAGGANVLRAKKIAMLLGE